MYSRKVFRIFWYFECVSIIIYSNTFEEFCFTHYPVSLLDVSIFCLFLLDVLLISFTGK